MSREQQGQGGASATPAVPQTAGEMLNLARAFLDRKGLADSRLEAELLVAHALDLDRLKLYLQLDQSVSEADVDLARSLLVRRARQEPVAYITGKKEFYGRAFAVGDGVLIPRPETELIVDLARARFGATKRPEAEFEPEGSAPPELEEVRVCDVGTGSGCLAVTLALELSEAHSLAIDLSAPALAWAQLNAKTHEADVEFMEGDALRILRDRTTRIDSTQRFELLVSNPPYVLQDDAEKLSDEVRKFEPGEALFAPKGDPDYWVRSLIELAPALLEPGGLLLVELGYDQGGRVRALCEKTDLDFKLHEDLDGHERVLEVNL